MDEALSVFVVVGGLWVLIGFTADAIARAVIRRKLADKDLSAEQMEALLRRRVDPDNVLKWALLTTAIGAGFVVLEFLPEGWSSESFSIGLVLIFAGGALFLYRAAVKRNYGE